METLPYSFDLLFDIKTYGELFDKYHQLKSDLHTMEELIESHKIKIPIKIPMEGETDEF